MENWIPRKRFYNSLFLWIEENGSRSCPWSFRVVIAILFPLLTLQEQIRFDLYNLRNWNWNASKLYRIKKRFLERNSSFLWTRKQVFDCFLFTFLSHISNIPARFTHPIFESQASWFLNCSVFSNTENYLRN